METPPFTMFVRLHFLRIEVGIETMAQRNIFYASPLSEFQNVHLLNPPNVNPQRHIERTMLGTNDHTIMNYNLNLPHPNTPYSGAICDNYQHPNQNMTYQTQVIPYCYNHNANQTGATMFYPPAENSRMAFKRKTPAHPLYENPYGYLSTGNSSNFPVPPNHFQLKHMLVCSSPLHPNSNFYRYQDETVLSAGEEFQRNVRIRHNNAPQPELNPAWQPSSSRPTQLLHPSSSISAATVVVGPLHHSSLPGTYSQWNHPTTNSGSSGHLMNQPVSRNIVFGGDTEQNSVWISDNSRNSHSRLPNWQGSDAQATWGCPISFDRRLVLNRTSSNYTNLAATQGNGPSGTGFVSYSRIPRSTNLQYGSTNRGPRNNNAGWPTFIPGNAQRGWTSRGFSMTDIPYSAYALDLFDEHRDMRLDIDNMSYEELLVLEETIGNVSAGLSEDQLSKCLTERMYCSSASDDENEACCPICLEEFKDEDSQGVMRCQHVYHFTCIKKWLRLKKTCPACKAPALDDDVKQKQKVSS